MTVSTTFFDVLDKNNMIYLLTLNKFLIMTIISEEPFLVSFIKTV